MKRDDYEQKAKWKNKKKLSWKKVLGCHRPISSIFYGKEVDTNEEKSETNKKKRKTCVPYTNRFSSVF